MIRARLQEQGLPGDLVYLALIESGFSNSATSRAKAVGMWQFMKGTAKGYGLRVDSWVDERRDPYRATAAAARHLRQSQRPVRLALPRGRGLQRRRGQGLPGRAPPARRRRADSLNSDATFFRLYDTKLLRRETKDYVPKLIAAARIAKEPARYGFAVDAAGPPTYDSIIVPTMTGLDVIARLADTTVAAIRELNPQYLRLATPPGVPLGRPDPGGARPDHAGGVRSSCRPTRRITFLEHTVARGQTLSGIAARYGVSTRLVIEANPRVRGRKLRPGQRIIVPTGGAISTSVARRMADPVEPAASSPSGFHRVRRGETLSGLAVEYGVTVRQLRAWNALGENGMVRAGQRIRVTAPAAACPRPRGVTTTVASATTSGERIHQVRRGETLTGLAKRYRVSVQALREANGMSAGDALRAGVTLKIPG